MKKNKFIFLIANTAIMYLRLAAIIALFVFFRKGNMDEYLAAIGTLFVISIVLDITGMLMAIAGSIYAFIMIPTDLGSPYKMVMIIKLYQIPCYIGNYLYWVMVGAGFLNPWLFLAYFFIIGIGVVITYIYMISTSIPNLIYFFKSKILRLEKTTPAEWVAVVFHFIFCLDVIGAIMLYFLERGKQDNQIIEV